MNIQSKDWHAHLDKMPGSEKPKLTVSGIVTVPNSTTEVTLVMSKFQDKSPGLRLELHLEDKGVGLPVLTEKTVSYSQPAGGYDVTQVTIFHDKDLVTVIKKIEVVN